MKWNYNILDGAVRRSMLLLLCAATCSMAEEKPLWSVVDKGGIRLTVPEGSSHFDHVEMAGLKMASILRWGIEPNGAFALERSLMFPMLRLVPNMTHSSFMQRLAYDIPSQIIMNGWGLNKEKVKQVQFDGMLVVDSELAHTAYDVGLGTHSQPVYKLALRREIFPARDLPALCERYTLRNIASHDVTIQLPDLQAQFQTAEELGVTGSYTVKYEITGGGHFVLKPKESLRFYSTSKAFDENQKEPVVDVEAQWQNRRDFMEQMRSQLVLVTPDETINKMFEFAKIRGCESIFDTKGGLMHGPGGERYYAAIWANDQAEYINPFFPFLKYEVGRESALNSFRHFARFMNEEYKPIPSSIIAEGDSIWNGVGDRGDAAMIAYGAARYALARASKEEATELWPLIEWCLEYCHRKLNAEGVVQSDTDELEHRFPAGKANLCTSSLYYDALLSAAYMVESLNLDAAQAALYRERAALLKKNIDTYFAAPMEGFDTYRYYEGNDVLRSWICIPLTVDIFDRVEGTIKALFSPHLWTKDGVLTQAGTSTFWDRSTLYALRGVYAAGHPDEATEFVKRFSAQRLLGQHVPYCVEAYPEGGQRQLSAESGLYCRIFVEGLFGIRPTGFDSFKVNPQLPKEWNEVSLKNIYAFGGCYTLVARRTQDGIESALYNEQGEQIAKGLGACEFKLKN